MFKKNVKKKEEINKITRKEEIAMYPTHGEQQKKEIETIRKRTIELELSDADVKRIAEKAGIIEGLSRRMRPVLHFLFPDLPQEHPANEYIATNMIANVFGLGWAATPAGLKAMEALQERNLELCGQKGTSRKRGPDIATDEMCTFLIVNISSLQLIPVNIIAYRSQYGSVNPAAVVGPGLIATICSTAAAIIFCKLKKRC